MSGAFQQLTIGRVVELEDVLKEIADLAPGCTASADRAIELAKGALR
jgi:hypothetical protein